MAMDDRKRRVLQAVVTLYGIDGEPVGSGLLCRYFDSAVSSATLRNEMAALTKLGLLEQPHTSAGRVPSAKGYRYYLDHMDAPAALPAAEKRKIDRLFAGMDYEPDKLTQSAAKALSDWAGFTVVATTPAAPDLCIAHFEVVQVGRYSAAVLAVTGAGGVRTRVARVEGGLSRTDAVQLAGLLNRSLTFVSPPDLTEALLAELAMSLGPRRKELWGVVQAAADLLEEAAKPRVHVGGIAHLLEWPELSGDLARVLELFGDEETACRLCAPAGQRGDVLLGEDLSDPIPGLSVIRKRYLAGGGLMGGLAIVGPARMPFQKLMPGLDYFALKLGQSMAGNLQEDAT